MKRSFIDFLNIVGFIVVLAVVVFAAYTLFIDNPFYENSSFGIGLKFDDDGRTIGSGEESGSYTAENRVGEIEIGNISGRIEAEKWNGKSVQLDYVKRGPGRHPEVRIDESGDRLKITAVYPKMAGNFGSVDFFLKIPAGIEYLKANTVSGDITLTGLGEETEQKLSSTSGSIKTDSSGDIDISSVSGSLSFGTSGDRVSASTTSGRINGIIEHTETSGNIDINSVSGRVVLEVPSTLNADINMHSVSGSVSSELPVAVTTTKRNSIKGSIGNGGTDIDISTVSGSIKISTTD